MIEIMIFTNFFMYYNFSLFSKLMMTVQKQILCYFVMLYLLVMQIVSLLQDNAIFYQVKLLPKSIHFLVINSMPSHLYCCVKALIFDIFSRLFVIFYGWVQSLLHTENNQNNWKYYSLMFVGFVVASLFFNHFI